jgi:hypothetical protein
MDMTGDDWVSWSCPCSSSKAEDVVDGFWRLLILCWMLNTVGGANSQGPKLGCLQRSNS